MTYTFFNSETSPFSQWYRVSFLVDRATGRAAHRHDGYSGAMYNCAEQWMMHSKAMLFNDHATATKILLSDHPREQKALGRKVKGFNETVWRQRREVIVHTGNREKFTQNPELLELLLATQGTTLVEASPHDRVWGIGLEESDPRAQHPSKWQGQNLLGKMLTRLRNELLLEDKSK